MKRIESLARGFFKHHSELMGKFETEWNHVNCRALLTRQITCSTKIGFWVWSARFQISPTIARLKPHWVYRMERIPSQPHSAKRIVSLKLFRINKAPPSRFRVSRRKNGFHVAEGGQQAQAVAQQFAALFHHVFHHPVVAVQHQRLPQRAHAEQA
jgi:hypothetical protein